MRAVLHSPYERSVVPCYFVWGEIASAAAGFVGGTLGVLGDMRNTDKTNQTNKDLTRETNEMNYKIAQEANQLNREMFNEQMDYTKAVQQETWNREDTSYQRTVADAQAAGLSPLAALQGGTNGAGQVVSQPSAPQMQAAQMHAAVMNPYNIDTTYISDLARATMDSISRDKKMSSDEKIAELDRQASLDELTKTLESTSANLMKQIQSSENIADKNRQMDYIMSLNSLNELSRSNKEKEMKAWQEQFSKDLASATNGLGVSYKVYTDKSEYESALNAWCTAYSVELLKYSSMQPSVESMSKGSGTGVSAGVGFGSASQSGTQSSGGFMQSASRSVPGINANASTNLSESESYGRDSTEQDRAVLKQWLSSHPMPVYKGAY